MTTAKKTTAKKQSVEPSKTPKSTQTNEVCRKRIRYAARSEGLDRPSQQPIDAHANQDQSLGGRQQSIAHGQQGHGAARLGMSLE